jgi:hypothetical protein
VRRCHLQTIPATLYELRRSLYSTATISTTYSSQDVPQHEQNSRLLLQNIFDMQVLNLVRFDIEAKPRRKPPRAQ